MLLLNAFSNPTVFIALIVALLIGITVHEFAHAWMANYLGDDTARIMGRLSLNPLKHLDPLGVVFLLIIGFGWGKPVPFNPGKLKDPNGSIKVALAGVTANLLVALILGIILRVATAYGIAIDSNPFLTFISIIVFINLGLIAFNIIPIPPLDGSKVIESYMSYESILRYEQLGPILLFGLIIAQTVLNVPILFTVLEPIIRVLSFVTTGMPNIFGF
jgi:Zn-dependent protease